MTLSPTASALATAASAVARPTAGPSTAYVPKAVLDQLAAARKAAIGNAVTQARGGARFQPDDMSKDLARAKLQALIERVKILKKLYGANPREMARALTEVFKELKAAVKAYQQATGDELGMAGEAAEGALGEAVAQPPVAASQSAAAATAGAGAADASSPSDGDAAAPTAQAPAEPTSATSSASDPPPAGGEPASGGASTYAAVTQGVREGIGQDALSFDHDVRDFVQTLSDLLDTARMQTRTSRPDKATRRAFEDADKQLKALRDDLDDLDRDVRAQVPTLGLRLSVAA
ncbi:hypothetical protein ACO2Q3_14490 [Caulobacter sp. KR2-114]|uniref:hypothetical protein n=1 Tax=Caulobacter sp. KR2-114 TaxID=3400912 RepID=UPI003C1023BF